MIICWIAVSQIAPYRRHIPDLWICDRCSGIENNRIVRSNQIRCFQVSFPRQPTDLQKTAFLLDVRKVRQPIDIDNELRPRQSDLHHRNQALAAAQNFCTFSMLLKESNRFRNGLRAEILEGLGDHFSPFKQATIIKSRTAENRHPTNRPSLDDT